MAAVSSGSKITGGKLMLYKREINRKDMISCVLCSDAPCSAACPKMDIAGLLRNVWFDNEDIAALRLSEEDPCVSCDRPCENACVNKGQVPIRDIIGKLVKEVRPKADVKIPEDYKRLECDKSCW